MSVFNNKTITNAGMNLIAQGMSGGSITFKNILLGSGTYTGQDLANQTSLIKTENTLAITGVNRNGSTVSLTATLTQEQIQNDYAWSELGVIAEGETGGEILYLYGHTTQTSIISRNGLDEKIIQVTLLVSNVQNVTATIDNSLVYLTQSELDNHNAGGDSHADIRKELTKLSEQMSAIDISWESITGKPDTFPPSSHTHPKSEITDFPTSLPANGGNADTVDGKHATDFLIKNERNITQKEILLGNGGWGGISGDSGGRVLLGANMYTDGSPKAINNHGSGATGLSFSLFNGELNILKQNGEVTAGQTLSPTSYKVYSELTKPTKADVGLGSVNNWGATTAVNDASTTKYATASAVKQAYDKALQAGGKTWVPSNNVRHTVTIQPKFYGNNNGYYQPAKSLGRVYVPPKARVRVKVSAYTVTQGSTSGRDFYAQVELGMFKGGCSVWDIPQGSEISSTSLSNHIKLRNFPCSKGVVGTNANAVTNAQQIDMDLNYHGAYYADESVSFDGGWATYGVTVYTAYIHSCQAIKVDICYDEVNL